MLGQVVVVGRLSARVLHGLSECCSLRSTALIKEVGQPGQEVLVVLRGMGRLGVPDDSCLGDLVLRGGGGRCGFQRGLLKERVTS